MKMDVKTKHENALLGRQEVEFTVSEVKSTPSRKEIREKVAALLNADEKNLIVDVFGTSYGTSEIKGVARVYKNERDLKRTELEYIVHRNFGKPEKPKPAAEAPAAAEKK